MFFPDPEDRPGFIFKFKSRVLSSKFILYYAKIMDFPYENKTILQH
jgi:hypothetical protein